MKVGTDGCLLGAWADIEHSRNILDIGCGSGLISIMAAQRSNAKITAVEIDGNAATQARENADNSPWGNRIAIVNCDILKFQSDTLFDAIVSNPPFFSGSLKCSETSRTIARHNEMLPCAALMQKAKELLSGRGTFSVVIPSDAANEWCDEALFKGLSPRRITYIHTLPHKPAKRVLIEFIKGAHPTPATSNLILEASPGIYTKEAAEILRDFYIKL